MFGVSSRNNRILVFNGSGFEQIEAAFKTWGSHVSVLSDISSARAVDFNNLYGLVVLSDQPEQIDKILDTYCGLMGKVGRRKSSPINISLLSQTLLPAIDEGNRWQQKLGPTVVLRSLSLPSRAARLLLSRFPLHLAADVVFGQTINLLIIGFAELGQAIAVHAMRLAQYRIKKPIITVVDSEPERCESAFFQTFPQVQNVAQIRFTNRTQLIPDPEQPYTSVYVCEASDQATVDSAADIRERLRREQHSSPPIFMNLSGFDRAVPISDWDGVSFPFSAVRDVCVPDVLFGFHGDALASIIHDYYRDSIAAQGRSLDGTPAGESWENLYESYKQASRHQADHVPGKLASIDSFIVHERESDFFAFTASEAEHLSIIEHDRWCADRYLDGWQYGPERDNTAKIHPELIAYDDLTDDMKDLDRYAVRLVPALLGRQGLAVKRGLNLVSIVESAVVKPGQYVKEQLGKILSRLRQRFPDRSLVLNSDLVDPAQRLLARCALEEFSFRLRVILHRPVQDVLNNFSQSEERCDYLQLLSRSERRISIRDSLEWVQWVDQRAQILLVISDNPGEYSPVEYQVPRTSEFVDSYSSVGRRVLVDASTGQTEWTFEY